jgi:3-isopropylmalate dehydratase small subunit
MNNFEDLINQIKRKGSDINIDSLKKMLNTPDGQRIRSRIKNMDKKALLNMLNKLDTKNIPDNQKLNEMSKDPNLIYKLNSFLNKNNL